MEARTVAVDLFYWRSFVALAGDPARCGHSHSTLATKEGLSRGSLWEVVSGGESRKSEFQKTLLDKGQPTG